MTLAPPLERVREPAHGAERLLRTLIKRGLPAEHELAAAALCDALEELVCEGAEPDRDLQKGVAA